MRLSRRTIAILLLPSLLALGVVFVAPLTVLFRMAFNLGGGGGRLVVAWSIDSYQRMFADSFYWRVVLNTLRLAAIVTVITAVLSYIIALFLLRTTSRYRNFLFVLAIAPVLTSQVVRTYGWMALLGDNGVVNGTLMAMGLTDTPVRLSNNFTGVVIALVEILMPYSILIMYVGFGKITQDLEHAARSLGAGSIQTFRRIILPLSLPGLYAASLLVFVLTVASFVTPQLLGGGRVFVLATEIYNQALQIIDWPMAGALSVLLIAVFVAIGVAVKAGQSIVGRGDDSSRVQKNPNTGIQ